MTLGAAFDQGIGEGGKLSSRKGLGPKSTTRLTFGYSPANTKAFVAEWVTARDEQLSVSAIPSYGQVLYQNLAAACKK